MKSTVTQPETRRPYRMKARSAAAEAASVRILHVARRRFATMAFDHVTLGAVAADAQVGVQTVLRRFGSKEDLLVAVAQRRSEEIRAVRDASPGGDPAKAVHDLVDTYERFGEEVLPLMAQENRHPVIAAIVQSGREYHHSWVERIWSSSLRGLEKRDRQIRKAQLIAATDLHAWKIYRRDVGLDWRSTEAAVVGLCALIVNRN